MHARSALFLLFALLAVAYGSVTKPATALMKGQVWQGYCYNVQLTVTVTAVSGSASAGMNVTAGVSAAGYRPDCASKFTMKGMLQPDMKKTMPMAALTLKGMPAAKSSDLASCLPKKEEATLQAVVTFPKQQPGLAAVPPSMMLSSLTQLPLCEGANLACTANCMPIEMPPSHVAGDAFAAVICAISVVVGLYCAFVKKAPAAAGYSDLDHTA